MCYRYSCIFNLIPTKFALKKLLKHKNIPFLTLNFFKQNGVNGKLSNVITLSQRHSHAQRFWEQKHRQNDQSGPHRFLRITSCKYLEALLKYFKVQTHVQTKRDSPDLNMDFRSFDNGLKQLYE